MAAFSRLCFDRRMLAYDRRSEPRVGERVPYVIVYGTPGLPLIQLVRRPLEVLQDPSLRLNATYYITKQILPPLARVFSLIGIDVFSWYHELPRVSVFRQKLQVQCICVLSGLIVTASGMRLLGGNSKGYFVKQCLGLKYAVLILRSSVWSFFHVINQFFQPALLCRVDHRHLPFPDPFYSLRDYFSITVFLAVCICASDWSYHLLNLSILGVGTPVFPKCSEDLSSV